MPSDGRQLSWSIISRWRHCEQRDLMAFNRPANLWLRSRLQCMIFFSLKPFNSIYFCNFKKYQLLICFSLLVRSKEFPGNLTYVIERFACYRSSVPCFMFSKKETIGDNDSADKVASAFTCCQRIDPFAWKIYWTLNDKLEFLVNWLRGFR